MNRLSVLFTATLLFAAPAAAQCPAPAAPTFTTLSDSVVSGNQYTASWSPSANLQSGGRYAVHGSFTTGFEELVLRYNTVGPSVTFTTPSVSSQMTLYLRVRAVQPCGTAGPFSSTLSLALAQAPTNVIFTVAGPSWVVPVGGPSPSSAVVVRNVGGTTGGVSFNARGGFFTVTPNSATLAPGATARLTLQPLSSSLQATTYLAGQLDVVSAGGTDSTPVQLVVTPPPPAGVEDLTVDTSSGRVVFDAAAGKTPAAQTITVTLSAALAGVYLAPRIAPGGTWLSLDPGQLTTPVPASGETTLTLSVDRSKRTAADGVAPLRTLLRLHAAGAPDDLDHSAIVEVVDVDTPSVQNEVATNRGVSAQSFFIPAVVKASGASEAFFFSDGWIRNLSAFKTNLFLWYTLDGKDGTSDPSVLLSQTSLEGGSMLRVSDLLGALFKASGSGTVEVRSPIAPSLTVRTTVESVTGGDRTSRYGSEVPVVARGSGAGVGDQDLLLPGIDDDGDRRANLILSETSGAPVAVAASLYDGSGNPVGGLVRTIQAYSKVQVNRVVSEIAPGRTISGASIQIHPTSGTGKVVPLATVIDNRSNSFSVIKGRPLGGFASNSRTPLAEDAFVMPSAVRLTGAYNTQYTTTMSMVNGTGQPVTLTLTYNYVDVGDGNATKSVTKTVTIPARGSLSKVVGDDIVANLFLVTSPSYGWIKVAGGTTSVVAVAGINAAVDPNDDSKGVKTAQVDAVSLSSPSVMETGDDDHRFAGAEKSDAKRTNLVLVETSGQASEVLVRINTPTGQMLAQRTFGVGAGQYLQINDIFGEGGVDAGDGPFQNSEVTVQVTSGAGKVIGLATVIDNVSRNPEIFVLQSAGVPPASLGF